MVWMTQRWAHTKAKKCPLHPTPHLGAAEGRGRILLDVAPAPTPSPPRHVVTWPRRRSKREQGAQQEDEKKGAHCGFWRVAEVGQMCMAKP
jgi:hypothetical protein